MDKQPNGLIRGRISQDDFDEHGMTGAIDQELAILRSSLITEYGIHGGRMGVKITTIVKPSGPVTDSGGEPIMTRGEGNGD